MALLVLGIGLIAAPAIFQMFDRAPKGKTMITSFKPYMTEAQITGFQHDMRTIDAAVRESKGQLRTSLAEKGIPPDEVATTYPLLTSFEDQWPAIDDDMSQMLTTMHGDLGNYRAVADLPPFDLFPWFFVVPGVILVVAALLGLRARRLGRSTLPWLIVAVVIGAGLVVAPGIFQMMERAPKGGHMVDDFKPLMTEAKVRKIQGYFVVIGGGEGTLRAQVLPKVTGSADPATEFPAIARFNADWPHTSNQMAPMIGAMSDNLGNYAAVAALPPFPLFPWFFIVPGVLIVVFAALAQTTSDAAPALDAETAQPKPSQPLGDIT